MHRIMCWAEDMLRRVTSTRHLIRLGAYDSGSISSADLWRYVEASKEPGSLELVFSQLLSL